VGALGGCALPVGWLCYVGSALGGLRARLYRHARSDKRYHWHIDYVLAAAPLVEVWCRADSARLECAWARQVAACPGVTPYPRPLGASDCACYTHLFSMATVAAVQAVYAALDARWPLLRCARQPTPFA